MIGNVGGPVRLDMFTRIINVHWKQGPSSKDYPMATLVYQSVTDFHPEDPGGTPDHYEIKPGHSNSFPVDCVDHEQIIEINETGIDQGTFLLYALYGNGEGAEVVFGDGHHTAQYHLTGSPTGLNPEDMPPGTTTIGETGALALSAFQEVGAATIRFRLRGKFTVTPSLVTGLDILEVTAT